MSVKNILSITEARSNLFKIINQVEETGIPFTLTERGRSKAVLMSVDEFDSWQETIEVMRDFPNLTQDIKEAEEDYKKGNCVTLEKILTKEGFILTDKGKKRYAVSSLGVKKGSKRSK
ncbi:type II toxin-antitoxin system Phd/YefM family antitoxin [bacterium]|nr:type II toxin-antitoxin system Phd/YefM family antitoxin [bacterium]